MVERPPRRLMVAISINRLCMAITKYKGAVGLTNVMACLVNQKAKIFVPIDEDCQYDLVVDYQNYLYRVQVKYAEAKNGKIVVKTRSTNNYCEIRYTKDHFDVIAVWDNVGKKAYFISSNLITEGMTEMTLRLDAPKNNQTKNIRLARNYEQFNAAVA